MNPLMENSNSKFEAIDFTKIKEEHFIPALDAAIKEAKENLELVKKEENISFDSIILKEETSADRLDQIVSTFYSLYSAHCTDELSAIAEEFNKKLTEYSSDVSLDGDLFAKIKQVYDKKDELDLNAEQLKVLNNSYKGFTRNGALLSAEDKEKLREIDQKLAKLSLNFSENVRKATNSFVLEIDNDEDIKGMPEGVIEAAKETAKAKEVKAKYAFTLDFPSYLPFMQYCPNRELRKQMWTAASTKANGGEFDNRETVLETLKTRKERATLLGYKDHPEYVLENRMAKSAEDVLSFQSTILEKAKPKAKEEFEKLKAFKEKVSGEADFRKYDSAMYAELLKKEELDFDDEALRPYFKLENVVKGVFDIANKLYGITFEVDNTIPKYHEDVMTYIAKDEDGSYLGLFYADFFPRKEKRPGAWMTTFRDQGYQFGEVKRPFVSIVCNFTKPTASKPSLLTLNEVLTLFHEFGHALHGLLAKATYKSVAGTNVYWDFVELPSQIMENWVYEKECLDMFAKHYETGETMPEELIGKVKKNATFLEGLGTLRQLSFGFLDMSWHSSDPEAIDDVIAFETNVMKEFDMYPSEGVGAMSPAFGHIFAGGYSAGYYSYKWAEVLDADAFAYFLENGIFDKETAKKFRENILERGGTADPMELYKKFRGKEPSSDALLKRAGLI